MIIQYTIGPNQDTSIKNHWTNKKKRMNQYSSNPKILYDKATGYHYGYLKKDFKKAEYYYKESIKREYLIGELGLARLYRDGMIYTESNYILPDWRKAYEHYLNFFHISQHPVALLEPAKMFHYGIHPVLNPDLHTARKLYKFIVQTYLHNETNTDNIIYVVHAKNGLRTLEQENNIFLSIGLFQSNIQDTRSLLDKSSESNQARSIIQRDTKEIEKRIAERKKWDEQQREERLKTWSHGQGVRSRQIHPNYQRQEDTIQTHVSQSLQDIKMDIVNDLENVHDHTLNQTAKESISQLEKETDFLLTQDECVSQYLSEINQLKLTKDQRNNIGQTLRTITSPVEKESKLAHYNMSEMDLFGLIWNRLNTYTPEDRNNAIYNLSLNLSECVERGYVVCKTGRFQRILQALQMTDKLVNIKPKWVIQQEMMGRGGVLRELNLKEILEKEKTLNENYAILCDVFSGKIPENKTPKIQEKVQKIEETIKKNIRSTLMEEYKTSIPNASIRGTMIDEWLDFI